jgi:uncharacterized membrane protein
MLSTNGNRVSWGVALPAAAGAALLANALDAATTWVGIARLHGQEAGIVAGPVVKTWGLTPALVLLKGGATLLILGLAVVGSAGQPRWWRAKPHHRWVVTVALGTAAAWFGFLALRNAVGAWMVSQIVRP